ncbi:MAG TPA: transcription elongation factor GreA [Candidatus Saccharimonadales bacterium]
MVVKKTFRLTKDGVTELEAELKELQAQRASIADAIRTAREFGDLSENTEYQSARAAQERNDARIAEVEHILQNVELIKAPRAGAKVQLGSKVTLKGNGATKEFQVVGTVEADPLNGKISDESPIGQALIGKKEGDTVEIKTPVETTTYTVAAIG